VPIFSGNDIRFTTKDGNLYATCLGWPGERITIETLKVLSPVEIRSVKMLGIDQNLPWTLNLEGLTIQTPSEKPCNHAYVFKIERA
jgi:alpha-L-fucosidase